MYVPNLQNKFCFMNVVSTHSSEVSLMTREHVVVPVFYDHTFEHHFYNHPLAKVILIVKHGWLSRPNATIAPNVIATNDRLP